VRLDPNIVNTLALGFQPSSYVRVMPCAHITTPLGMGFGVSRFSSPNNTFQLLYIAQNIATAIAETIVRDRFEGVSNRVLDDTEIENWAVAEITAPSSLTALDLRTDGLLRLGVSTDATRGKTHKKGQSFSEEIYTTYDFDALLYFSRLTSAHCLAVYDRAVSKLNATDAVPLLRHPQLVPALNSIEVKIRKS